MATAALHEKARIRCTSSASEGEVLDLVIGLRRWHQAESTDLDSSVERRRWAMASGQRRSTSRMRAAVAACDPEDTLE